MFGLLICLKLLVYIEDYGYFLSAIWEKITFEIFIPAFECLFQYTSSSIYGVAVSVSVHECFGS